MLVNSFIRGLDRMKVSIRRKTSTVWPQEDGRHAVSKFRSVSMKIAVNDRKSCNITAALERREVASQSS